MTLRTPRRTINCFTLILFLKQKFYLGKVRFVVAL